MSDDDLTRLCQWCGKSFRLGTVGRRAVYCGRTCREYAYRERRTQKRIADALANAGPVSSTVEAGADSVPTVDETESGGVSVPVARREPRRSLGAGAASQPTLDDAAESDAEEPPAEPRPRLSGLELWARLPPLGG
jgi:hypothetical protein